MSELKTRARERYGAAAADLHDLSRWMYENPEIAFEEHRSSARLAEFLTANGFVVEHPAYGLDTAFAARAGSDGPHVIICAEYDALAEVGHACGHNLIAAAACGAGVALADMVDDLGIRLTVLGTPAEEQYGGKVDLIHAGAFDDAAVAMMIHPAPQDTVDPSFLAVAHLHVEFHGVESHAAFAPQEGVNALDAAVQAYVNVSTLRQSLYATDKVHGVISYGGGAPNVIPHYTAMNWYVRAATEDRLEVLRERVVACFASAAQATGCQMELTNRGHGYTDMRNDPLMVELFTANAAALDRHMGRGADRDPTRAGSTDMANVSHHVPSIHPLLDIASLPAVNHQRDFAAATISPAGELAIRDGALGMAWTVIDLAADGRWDQLGGALD
jgi:amidohydrolase